jgi:hypothetical protein
MPWANGHQCSNILPAPFIPINPFNYSRIFFITPPPNAFSKKFPFVCEEFCCIKVGYRSEMEGKGHQRKLRKAHKSWGFREFNTHARNLSQPAGPSNIYVAVSSSSLFRVPFRSLKGK